MEAARTDAAATPALIAAIAEQSPDAIVFADREGTIRFWNGAAATLFGHSADEALGRSLDIVIPERLRESHWRGYAKAIDTGAMKYSGKAMTTRSMHKDGHKLYVELSFGLVRDGDGRVIGATATARDVTERQLARSSATVPATTA